MLFYFCKYLLDTMEANMNEINELPACPVETTLSLIGDKWKVLAQYLKKF